MSRNVLARPVMVTIFLVAGTIIMLGIFRGVKISWLSREPRNIYP